MQGKKKSLCLAGMAVVGTLGIVMAAMGGIGVPGNMAPLDPNTLLPPDHMAAHTITQIEDPAVGARAAVTSWWIVDGVLHVRSRGISALADSQLAAAGMPQPDPNVTGLWEPGIIPPANELANIYGAYGADDDIPIGRVELDGFTDQPVVGFADAAGVAEVSIDIGSIAVPTGGSHTWGYTAFDDQGAAVDGEHITITFDAPQPWEATERPPGFDSE